MRSYSVGDRVRVANASTWKKYIGAEGIVARIGDGYTVLAVTAEECNRVNGPGYDEATEWTMWHGHFTLELAGPQEPEQYEGWFV